MDKIKYKCLCCNQWEKEIPASWADVSPRFCGNSSCEMSVKKGKGKKSFKSHPEMLTKVLPEKPKAEDKTTKSPAQKVRGRKKK